MATWVLSGKTTWLFEGHTLPVKTDAKHWDADMRNQFAVGRTHRQVVKRTAKLSI